jgi:antitoxin (DNA-binding transcriptional repressor) of toxin-antitoxin stability system
MPVVLDTRDIPARINEIIGLVRDGVEVILTVDGAASARIVASGTSDQPRRPGLHRGATAMQDGFDEPLPDAFRLGSA